MARIKKTPETKIKQTKNDKCQRHVKEKNSSTLLVGM